MTTVEPVHGSTTAGDVLAGSASVARRLLPDRSRRMIGPWCFLAHVRPDNTSPLCLPPHPHTGMQVMTWLFEGSLLHRDSLGNEQLIRPGELNLMTAGTGMSHAQSPVRDHRPTSRAPEGVHLWACLPAAMRADTPPDFAHLPELPVYSEGGVTLTVFMGHLAGETSKAPTFSPLVGAQIVMAPGAVAALPVERDFEHGLLVARGQVKVDGRLMPSTLGDMVVLGPGRLGVDLEVPEQATQDAVLVLVGGEPFDEATVVWWTFVGRDHDEVVAHRDEWGAPGAEATSRFGTVRGWDGPPLAAPTPPAGRLLPTANRPHRESQR